MYRYFCFRFGTISISNKDTSLGRRSIHFWQEMFKVILTPSTDVDHFDCMCIRTVRTFVQETILFSDHLGTVLKLLPSTKHYNAGTVLTVSSIFTTHPNNHVIYCSDKVQKRNKVKCFYEAFLARKESTLVHTHTRRHLVSVQNWAEPLETRPTRTRPRFHDVCGNETRCCDHRKISFLVTQLIWISEPASSDSYLGDNRVFDFCVKIKQMQSAL